jgi:hypothetical protein
MDSDLDILCDEKKKVEEKEESTELVLDNSALGKDREIKKHDRSDVLIEPTTGIIRLE